MTKQAFRKLDFLNRLPIKDPWVVIMLSGFFIYIMAVFRHADLLANIISVITLFSASYLLYRSVQKTSYPYDKWLFGYVFLWFFADTVWFVLALMPTKDPMTFPYMDLLYTIPPVFLVIMIIHWVATEAKRWNLYQLFLDFAAVLFLLLYLLGPRFYQQFLVERSVGFDDMVVALFTFMGLFILVSSVTLYLSSYRREKSIALCGILIGLILYGSIEFLYAYLSLLDLYAANSFIDILYLIPPVLFALALYYQQNQHHHHQHQAVTNPPVLHHPLTLPDNYGKRKAPYVFLPLVLILFFFGEIGPGKLFTTLILLFLYYMMSQNIQLSIKNYHLLQETKEANRSLEEKVQEKTKSLEETNQVLAYYSYLDPLTDLSNRRAFIEYMDELTIRQQSAFHLFYMDLNRFKYINDTHGHDVGDKVLKTIARRLSENWIKKGRLFRIGGDEFALIVEGFYQRRALADIAKEIIQAVEIPISIDPYHFYLGISIGIVSYPKDAKTRKALMRYGDMTMYQAKNAFAQSHYYFYDSSIKDLIHEKHVLEMLLKQANANQDFFLVFQPQYEIAGKKLIGFEALLRWNHPDRGFISPAQFIPVAEETGLIIPLGEWVLKEAFRNIREINETYQTNYRISINVSPVQLQSQKFMDTLLDRMRAETISPSWIDLEVTEGAAFRQGHSIEAFFDHLRELGINASLDDFGTGYSSLSYIKRYDIDRLKIARELISGIHEEDSAKEIVRAIILMAKGLHLNIIAEGVEEEAQLALLQSMGCHEIQGYLWGKPVPRNDLEEKVIKPSLVDPQK
ncbi:diguanylate cyclase (GGDEF) domain-containing protein [Tindallia magadiensis]|uniref:Diguanylate cyclase (GGDEF) domain-containing protein n=1 Tax=Tindallia magadiensis TaxID=69895 RepID=A0A1I3H8V0_9FIRM|nr:bifunctional diguanylate cyclase/phosphodiesterase [Tindallia magadiensis]SFI32059.1 diguanylate cyclase (GGDEF) domain-containing protein [Tindallia magadiensis]